MVGIRPGGNGDGVGSRPCVRGVCPGGEWDVVGSRPCGGVCPGGYWDVVGSRTSFVVEFVPVGMGTEWGVVLVVGFVLAAIGT